MAREYNPHSIDWRRVGAGGWVGRGKLWVTNKGAAAVALALIRVRKQDVPNFLEETYTFQRGGSSSALSALNKSYSVKELVRTVYAKGTKVFYRGPWYTSLLH
jgi:hypothetical protein